MLLYFSSNTCNVTCLPRTKPGKKHIKSKYHLAITYFGGYPPGTCGYQAQCRTLAHPWSSHNSCNFQFSLVSSTTDSSSVHAWLREPSSCSEERQTMAEKLRTITLTTPLQVQEKPASKNPVRVMYVQKIKNKHSMQYSSFR